MFNRAKVQVQFRKGIWICEDCGQEDWQDFNVDGYNNVYEHNCSNCNKWSNSFKEYNGYLSYTPEEYQTLDESVIVSAKQSLCDEWLVGVKNPPPPPAPEPTPEDIQAMIDAKQAELDGLVEQKVQALVKIEEEKLKG